MHVELWSRVGGSQRIIALIHAPNGKLVVEEKEYVSPDIKRDIEKAYAWKKDEGEFGILDGMTREFSGSYYWAKLIRG